jgi:hypothetical protein
VLLKMRHQRAVLRLGPRGVELRAQRRNHKGVRRA